MAPRRDWIVIGGSGGALNVICRLVRALPDDFPATLVAVLHGGLVEPEMVLELIGRNTTLRVSQAERGETALAGHLYIAPPGHHLVIRPHGILEFDDGPKVLNCRPAADPLFQSAAEVFGSRVIGLVLSGGGGDGTQGLVAIKAHGGLSVVQSPADSLSPDMPTSALLGDHPDFSVLVDDLGPLLVGLVQPHQDVFARGS